MGNFQDLVGQKFNRLTVLEYVGNRKRKCQCDCGNVVFVNGCDLTRGYTQSCGCLHRDRHFKDLSGRRFGRLLVLEYAGLNAGERPTWRCVCDCGNITIVYGQHLHSGATISCGCFQKERTSAAVIKRNKTNHPMKDPNTRKKLSESRMGKFKGAENPNWRGGISFEPYCPKWTDDLKYRIRTFFDNTCMMCGKSRADQTRELTCHHVEYNKQACCDGKPVQFAALCNRCHTRTNYDRDRWEAMIHRVIDEIYGGRSYFTKEEIY